MCAETHKAKILVPLMAVWASTMVLPIDRLLPPLQLEGDLMLGREATNSTQAQHDCHRARSALPQSPGMSAAVYTIRNVLYQRYAVMLYIGTEAMYSVSTRNHHSRFFSVTEL